jgi:O-acetylhomoserine/O-acetylserine sulfhydrylase-like pyridoxal-dependent enzyme
MSTRRRRAASRANAKLSTGPLSDAGKQIVSANALNHGLASSKPIHVALPGEEAAFVAHLESYRTTCAPANQPEEDLVRTLAESYWRLERAHKLENALFIQILKQDDYKDLDPMTAQAQAWSNKDTGLQRIALYAQRIQRTAEKTAVALKAMQQERKAAYNQAKQEAMYLTQLALANANSFEPALHFGAPDLHGGFVYSTDEIKLALLRVTRLEEARARFNRAA